MAGETLEWFSDALDDVLKVDGIPSFDGGQFSNWRANLLQPNQSKLLTNCDVDRLGKLRTRRGTIQVGPGTAGTGTLIQGLTSYQTSQYNYIVAANNGQLWAFDGTNWNRIATGGISDNDQIYIVRSGYINNAGGYSVGDTVLTVDLVGYVGLTPPAVGADTVAPGEHLYFLSNLRTDYYEYTIAAVNVGTTTTITLASPLVFNVQDDWQFAVLRPANVNHALGYAGGYTGAIVIDGYTGIVNNGETFVVASENINHSINAHSETSGNTTSITDGVTALQADYTAASTTDPIVFAQGTDVLYFCDGVGPIYSWNGKNTRNISQASVLDVAAGHFIESRTKPPVGCNILVWFQSRLIASGIAAEPDTVYFSDFLDGTKWDRDYQSTRIGGGESDPITGLVPWTDLNMLVTKKNSIYLVDLDPSQNPDPTDPTLLVASFAIKKIHGLIGCPAPLTARQVGGGSSSPGSDVFFLDGDKKVRSIRRVLAAETQQQVGDPTSTPIQDYLDRCNIANIKNAVAMYHNDHYILAFPIDGATHPNAVVAFNLLTQSWCGQWEGWTPTCFAIRTDLGSYSKLIYGASSEVIPFGAGIGLGGVSTINNGGKVFQWLDDLSMESETNTTYQDGVHPDNTGGIPIRTHILTRAITFGDPFSYKTGLNVEFEFDESVAGAVTIQVVLDKVVQAQLIATPFSTLTTPAVRLPVVIPFTLSGSPDLLRMAFDLQRYGTWRELQFSISSTQDKLSIRSIRVTGWSDTIRLQTIPGMLTS